MAKSKNTLAIKMTIALITGIAAGFLCILLRERLGAQSKWKMIKSLHFKILLAKGAEKSLDTVTNCGTTFHKFTCQLNSNGIYINYPCNVSHK